MVAHRQPWLNDVMRLATEAGSLRFGVVALAAVGVLLWRRSPALAPGLVAGLFVSEFLVRLAKEAVGRQRPPVADALVTVTSPAMPSGHAANAAFVAMLCMLVLATRWPRWRLLAPVGVAWAVGVAATRVYLGAHWLSDVAAGLVMGAVLAAPLGWLVWRTGRRTTARRSHPTSPELAAPALRSAERRATGRRDLDEVHYPSNRPA